MFAAVNRATIKTMHSPAISSGVQAPPWVVADKTRPGMTSPTNRPPDITRASSPNSVNNASASSNVSGRQYSKGAGFIGCRSARWRGAKPDSASTAIRYLRVLMHRRRRLPYPPALAWRTRLPSLLSPRGSAVCRFGNDRTSKAGDRRKLGRDSLRRCRRGNYRPDRRIALRTWRRRIHERTRRVSVLQRQWD